VTTTTTTIPGQTRREDRADVGLETWPLVERAQSGDAEAFGELFRLYRQPVLSYVLKRVGGAARHQVAEDITSAVFMRALANIGGFTWQGRDVGAWFMTIARNLIADHFKSAHNRLSIAVEIDDAITANGWPGGWTYADEPHRDAVQHEQRAAIEAALADLSPRQALVIRLRYLLELSVEETRIAMGLDSDGAVKALTSRATVRLRKSERLAAQR